MFFCPQLLPQLIMPTWYHLLLESFVVQTRAPPLSPCGQRIQISSQSLPQLTTKARHSSSKEGIHYLPLLQIATGSPVNASWCLPQPGIMGECIRVRMARALWGAAQSWAWASLQELGRGKLGEQSQLPCSGEGRVSS